MTVMELMANFNNRSIHSNTIIHFSTQILAQSSHKQCPSSSLSAHSLEYQKLLWEWVLLSMYSWWNPQSCTLQLEFSLESVRTPILHSSQSRFGMSTCRTFTRSVITHQHKRRFEAIWGFWQHIHRNRYSTCSRTVFQDRSRRDCLGWWVGCKQCWHRAELSRK